MPSPGRIANQPTENFNTPKTMQGSKRNAAAKAEKDSIRNGEAEQLPPAETVPATRPDTTPAKVEEPVYEDFANVSTIEDKYQRRMELFKEVDTVFVGRFERSIAPGVEDHIDKAMLEFTDQNGMPVLLPGSMQLWDFFTNTIEPDVERRKSIFRITLIERVPNDKGGNDKFLRFRIQEARVKATTIGA